MIHSVKITLISIFIFTVFSCQESNPEIAKIEFNVPEGFELEEIYHPSEFDQGSWVSLTEDEQDNFYTCDQYGKIYHFPKPAVGMEVQSSDVSPVDFNIGYAHGLLWAFNSLYVVVVKRPDSKEPDAPTSGVYRLTDSDGDDQLDEMSKILDLDGSGEHGPHTLRVGPDGESIYLIAGNFNTVPDHFQTRLPRNWGEDNLMAPFPDARGHAVDLRAPGAWVARSDPDGTEWELVGAGMRNPFGMGFNEDGELFAYDADMEWDIGMPWYRPTRILHITSGSEYGWRTGSGKWPVEYPDNLSAVANMSQGSPTAVVMGHRLSFPAKYQRGLFACDWSFGTIYYVDLVPEGSTYTGQREEFLHGVPLPITNAIAGKDGHLYFLTGGRRLDSRMFRLRYTGDIDEDNAVANNRQNAELRQLRHRLEQFHTSNDVAVDEVWPYLNHEDRFIRYAARIALEHQDLKTWEKKIWQENDASRVIQAFIAYARSGGELNHAALEKLASTGWIDLRQNEKVAKIRAYQLLLIRQTEPENRYLAQAIINDLSPHYPSDDPIINRAISQVLLHVGAPDAVEKTMSLLARESVSATKSHPEILAASVSQRSEQYGPQIEAMVANMPPTEAIHYVTMLSHISEGWTKKLRTEYFKWFDRALQKKGGESYKPFLDNIRLHALEHVNSDEKEDYQKMSGFYAPTQAMANLPKPIGPGKNYDLHDLGRILLWGSESKLARYSGTVEDGLRAYQAAMCSSCHRMNGAGGRSGPDLSQVNTRFSPGDIATTILSPSEEISDQYVFTRFTMKNGDEITGRIVNEDESSYTVYQSPYDPGNRTKFSKSDVLNQEQSSISPMPAKLLNSLNEDEVRDLLVYLLTAGNAEHEYYNSKN